MTPGVQHDDIEPVLHRGGKARPAQAIVGEAMGQDEDLARSARPVEGQLTVRDVDKPAGPGHQA